mgnify:CR=1 FL=1
MKKNFLFQLLLAAFLLPAFSCSDDDSAPEINNATTLNMLDVENSHWRWQETTTNSMSDPRS